MGKMRKISFSITNVTLLLTSLPKNGGKYLNVERYLGFVF